MAERKAINKYIPPDFDPKKHGSINRYRGQHPLRHRARKLDQGILIVRFEMPFDIWCEKCNMLIAQGSRFNAEKKQDGNYFSTKIWKFTMKCESCKQTLVIKTDPKSRDFVVVSGGRKKEKGYEFAEDDYAPTLITDEEREKLETDAIYALDKEKQKEERVKELIPVMHELKKIQDTRGDDYSINSILRAKMRQERNRIQKDKQKYKSLAEIDLLKASAEDNEKAEKMKFVSNLARIQKRRIRSSSIFNKKPSSKTVMLKSALKSIGGNEEKVDLADSIITVKKKTENNKPKNCLGLISQYGEDDD